MCIVQRFSCTKKQQFFPNPIDPERSYYFCLRIEGRSCRGRHPRRDGTSTVSCLATNVTLIVEYGATVDSVVSDPDATLSDNIVTFFVSDLEDNPTNFTVMLDTCGATEPVDPIVSIAYSDDQGNSPDFTELLDITSDSTCPPGTTMTPPVLPPASVLLKR